MCGICGIINFDKRPVTKDSLKLMNDTMINRGPDDEGYFMEGNFGFAMRRLSIIDLDGGKQPIKSFNGRFFIVFNGELYNYIEIRKQLEKRNYNFYTDSDTEVVVNLFQEKGIDALDDLNGMFAIAIWDTLEKNLYLVRDRVGIKPIYYMKNNNSFVFCSNLDGIDKINNGSLSVNYVSLLKYLTFSYVPYPDSIYNNVFKIKPGQYLVIDSAGNIHKKQYWGINEIQYDIVSKRNYEEEIYEILNDAVQIQKRSDVPIGTFLSGGIDSSAVVALLSKNMENPINTFSVGFQNGVNELPFAKLVAEKYNTNHYEELISPDKMLKVFPDIIDNLDEPLSDNSLFPTYYLSKVAAERGIKVILNGTGGDELFGGYMRYFPDGLRRRLLSLIPNRVKMTVGSLINNQSNDNIEIVLNEAFDFYKSISGISLKFLNLILYNKSDILKVKELLSLSYHSSNQKNNSHTKHSLMLLDFNDYLVNDVLSVLDKMTMAVSLEGRVPLLDHRLAELCFKIPERDLFQGNERKGLLKKVLKGYLPPEIFCQPKAGFAMPINKWVSGYFKPKIKESFLDKDQNKLGKYFDLSMIENIIGRTEIPARYSNMIFSLFILNQWLISRNK